MQMTMASVLIFVICSIAVWLCPRLVVNVVHDAMCRWFDSGQDDGLIEREIDVVHYVQTPPPPPLEEEPGYFYY